MLSAQADHDHFWSYSNELYSCPGVEDALIELQDQEGLEPNLVLFCLYAAERGMALDADLIASARQLGEVWATGLVAPLRETRRRLKPFTADDATGNVVILRDRVKKAELLAEKGLQAALGALLHNKTRSVEFGRALAERNVTGWLAAEHIPMTQSRARAFTAIIDQAF